MTSLLSDAERYRTAQGVIRGQVNGSINQLYALALREEYTAEQTRDAFLGLLPHLTARHGEEAAAFAADWYEELRSRHGSATYFRAEMAPLTDGWEAMVDATTRRLAGHLWTDQPENMLPGLVDTIDKIVGEAASRTVELNANKDPDRPRYKVTMRSGACEWCREVASEIESLRPGETMRRWFHGNCHCTVEPIWEDGSDRGRPMASGTAPEGSIVGVDARSMTPEPG